MRLNDKGKINIDLPAVGIKRSWSVTEIVEALKFPGGSTEEETSCKHVRVM